MTRRLETAEAMALVCERAPLRPRRAVASCLSTIIALVPMLTGCGHAGPALDQPPIPPRAVPHPTHEAQEGSLQHTRNVPPTAYGDYLRGRLAEANGNWMKAAEAFERVLSVDPDADEVYPRLLHCCDELGDFDRALPALTTWSKRHPNVFRVRAETGSYFDRWGQKDRAIAELEAATECEVAERDQPTYYRVLQRLAALHLSDKQIGRALQCYERMRSTGQVPESAIEYKIGEAFFELGAYERAITHFETARSHGPTYAPVLRYLTFCYDETKQYEHAIAAAKSYLAVEKPNGSWPIQNHLANLYEKTLQFDQATALRDRVMKALSARIDAGSRNLSEYLQQSQLLRTARRFDDAISVLEKASPLAADTTSQHLQATYHLSLAEAYYDKKEDTNVERELRKTLELDPDRHEASNFLGYFYAERGNHLQEAERLISQALKHDPENGAYLDSLGWVYYRQATAHQDTAMLQKALDMLKQAAERVDDPVIRDHIGDVYSALGNLDEAERHWQLALALWKERPFANPGPEPVERKLKRLRKHRQSPSPSNTTDRR